MQQLSLKSKKHANVSPQKQIKRKPRNFQELPTAKGSKVTDHSAGNNGKANGFYDAKFTILGRRVMLYYRPSER